MDALIPNQLVVAVGPRCAGKTHWMTIAIEKSKGRLRQVKSNTTRAMRPPPDDESDRRAYNFWTEEEFDREIAAGRLIKTGKHSSFRYGLHIPSIEAHLAESHGIIALMPDAAEMLYKLMHRKFPTIVVVFRPSIALLLKNMKRRGGLDNLQSKLAVMKESYRVKTRAWEIPILEFPLDGSDDDKYILLWLNPENNNLGVVDFYEQTLYPGETI